MVMRIRYQPGASAGAYQAWNAPELQRQQDLAQQDEANSRLAEQARQFNENQPEAHYNRMMQQAVSQLAPNPAYAKWSQAPDAQWLAQTGAGPAAPSKLLSNPMLDALQNYGPPGSQAANDRQLGLMGFRGVDNLAQQHLAMQADQFNRTLAARAADKASAEADKAKLDMDKRMNMLQAGHLAGFVRAGFTPEQSLKLSEREVAQPVVAPTAGKILGGIAGIPSISNTGLSDLVPMLEALSAPSAEGNPQGAARSAALINTYAEQLKNSPQGRIEVARRLNSNPSLGGKELYGNIETDVARAMPTLPKGTNIEGFQSGGSPTYSELGPSAPFPEKYFPGATAHDWRKTTTPQYTYNTKLPAGRVLSGKETTEPLFRTQQEADDLIKTLRAKAMIRNLMYQQANPTP
jgi:hypothetical protein